MVSAKATIHPIRALVRPRVISPETGDAIPLEDVLLEVCGSSQRVIEIVGGCGSGKSTALAHLAAILPPDRKVVLLDDASPESVAEATNMVAVVFTSMHPHSVPGAVSYRLVPWGDDELAEYLLAAHPARCRSVMARLHAAPDRSLPKGFPEIWRLVLDRMAEDDSLRNVSQTLRQELQRGLPAEQLRAEAEQYCLARMTGHLKEAGNCHRGLRLLRADARILSLLRHDAVRLLLASDRLARLLETRSGSNWLAQRLSRDVVKAVGAAASSTARQNLARWLAEGRNARQAMAASVLHAADTGWVPENLSKGRLSGAYLDGAAWKAVNLRVAWIERTDFSNSDLTEASLDDAVATQASFREAVLHRASLVKFQGAGANFEGAELTSVNARSANLRDAILAGADFSGACLAKADFRNAKMAGARLVRTDLTYATLTDALIDGADFSSADLRWADLNRLPLRNARCAGANFAHANLTRCDLEGMDLPECNFAEAYLQGALLTASRMPRASFTGAFLQEAGLADIEWEEVDLRNADMRNCTFHLGSSRSGLVGSPIASEGSRTGFYSDDFDQQTYLAPEEIRKANLRGADLRNANLEGTDFYLVDLRGARYTYGQWEHLRRCGAILTDRA